MIKLKEKGQLIVLSGPSGCGKDTICSEVLKKNKNTWLSISCTSRQPRGKEVNGKDYFFLTNEEFEEKIKNNDFLEYAKYNNCYYGTPKSKIDEYLNKGIDVILVIEVQGALEVNEKVKDALFIFIMPPSMKELKRRLKSRGTEDEEKIMNRFKIAYKEINQITKYNYVVVNDEIEEAVTKVNSIIISEKCRVDRIEEVFLNNEEELIHETLMEKEFDNSVDEIGKK